MQQRPTAILVGAGLVLTVACGRDATPEKVAERPASSSSAAERPGLPQRLEVRLGVVREVLRKLKPAGKEPMVEAAGPLQPRPVLGKGEAAANATILQAEHADDPFMPLEADLRLGGDLHDALRWLASYDPTTGQAREKIAEATLERAATSRWLVLVRTIDFVEAEAGDQRTRPQPGKCEVEAWVLDTTTRQVMASVVVRAGSVADCRAKLATALAEATGGTFRIGA